VLSSSFVVLFESWHGFNKVSRRKPGEFEMGGAGSNVGLATTSTAGMRVDACDILKPTTRSFKAAYTFLWNRT